VVQKFIDDAGDNVSADAKKHGINVQINKQHYEAQSESMTGAELKTLASIPPGNKLFKEMPGKEPDQVVGDSDRVQLHNGDKFYDLPPGVVG
jgi:hypothetical protein